MAERIKVVIRVRPFNAREAKEVGALEKAFECQDPGTIFINAGDEDGNKENRHGNSNYAYDHVFASDPDGPCFATQETMFEAVGIPLVDNALNAFNGCAFFYGQTGSGKSFSCLGNPKIEEQKGILPRSCERMFQLLQDIQQAAVGTFKYNVLVSYLEIYNEKLSDLLMRKGEKGKDLQVRLHPKLGPHVPGLSEQPVLSYSDMNDLLEEGAKQRIVAATNMNDQSSRSHAIFSVDIRMSKNGVDSQARIHFVDLAGSERQKKTGAEGDRLKEGIAINQSLSVLGKVISALSATKSKMPAPFRESKLTLLLKEALSGNSRTVLVACVSPSAFNLEETVSTFEFATRCKMIATSASRNEVDRRDQIKALEDEKRLMEAQLKVEMEAKAQLQAHVESEKARRDELEREMADMERKIAEKHREDTEKQIQGLLEQHKAEQAELEEAKKRLEQAQGDEQQRATEALQRLEREQKEADSLRHERQEALEAQKKACEEQEQISAEREKALRELQEERHRLQEKEAEAAAISAEIEVKLQKEQEEKEELRLEQQRALEQVKKAEEERAQLLAEREDEQRKLQAEQANLGEELSKEKAEREKLRHERERALEENIRAAQEKEKAILERQEALKALEGERAKLIEREQKEAAERNELAAKLAQLEEDRKRKEEADREREEALNALKLEQAHKDAELRAKMEETQEEQRKRQELEGQQRQTKAELEQAQRERREREEELRREKADKEAKEKEMQDKLEDLRRKKEEGEKRQEQEMQEAISAKQREMEAQEREMKEKMEGLQALMASLKTDHEELQKKAQEESENRRNQRRGIAVQDCPNISNLHRDPFLNKTLVFYIQSAPEEEADGEHQGMIVGSNPNCEIHLNGLGIKPEMCVLRCVKPDEVHPSVYIKPKPDCTIKVNGKRIDEEERRLEDGERISIEDFIFELEIPSVRKAQRRNRLTFAQDEEEFERALNELEAGEEIDEKWKKGIESASFLIRHDKDNGQEKGQRGDKEAAQFLDQAKNAGRIVKKANVMLQEMPIDRRNGIDCYDLAVLLDPQGLPRLSVTAMELVAEKKSCVHVWTFEEFAEERFPFMLEAWDEFKQNEEKVDWQNWAWGKDTLRVYFDQVDEEDKKQKKIEELQLKVQKLKYEAQQKETERTQEKFQAAGGWLSALFGGGGGSSSSTASTKASDSSRTTASANTDSGWGIFSALSGVLGRPATAHQAPPPEGGKSPSSIANQVTIKVDELINGGCGLKIKDQVIKGFDFPEVAEKGWRLGDKIVNINGEQVNDQRELGKLFTAAKEKLPIVFTVFREPKESKSTKTVSPDTLPVPGMATKRNTRLPSSSRVMKQAKDPMGTATGAVRPGAARSVPPDKRASLSVGSGSSTALGSLKAPQSAGAGAAKASPGRRNSNLNAFQGTHPKQRSPNPAAKTSAEEKERRRTLLLNKITDGDEDMRGDIQVREEPEGVMHTHVVIPDVMDSRSTVPRSSIQSASATE